VGNFEANRCAVHGNTASTMSHMSTIRDATGSTHMFARRSTWAMILLAAFSFVFVGIGTSDAQDTAQGDSDSDDTVTMTLLHNNDGESKLLANTERGFPGIARFAQTWIDLGRATEADILLRVSAGDNFLASKEFSAGLALDGQPLYDSLALRGLYEAVGLGNHDFDFGPDVTARFIEGFDIAETSAPSPFLAANLDLSNEPALQALADQGWIAPSAIITDPASGESVGVIGAITPRLVNISSPRNAVVDPDVAGAVNAEVQALGDQGVNRIVLVSHLQGLTEDRELIPQLRGVDIVVAGGGDELLKNAGDTCQPDDEAFGEYPLLVLDADGIEIPVVTAPGGYRCIGRLDVTFDAEGQVASFTGESVGVPLDGKAEEFALSRVEEPLTRALADLEAQVIGSSDIALDGQRSSVRTAPTNVGELLADALLAAGQSQPAPADIAIQNAGGIRNDSVIAAGDLTAADTFDVAPFANFVVTGEIERGRLKELLEVAVAGLPDAQGTFPQIAGFSMDVDPTRPARMVNSDGDCSVVDSAGERIQQLSLDDGTVIVSDGAVVDGPPVVLATIDFLANGGDCYPLGDLTFTGVGQSYQSALSAFITDGLGGVVSGAEYPERGSRITLGESAAAQDDEPEPSQEPAEEEPPADEPDALPRTGTSSWLTVIIGMTVAIGGGMIFFEARRAGRLSARTRLQTTRASIPDSDEPLER